MAFLYCYDTGIPPFLSIVMLQIRESDALKIMDTISILKSPPIKRCCYLLNQDPPKKVQDSV